MSLLIARNREECENWKDVAVVVDVLRGATTVCALLNRGKKDVVLTEGEEQAAAFLARHPEFEAYSDFAFPGHGASFDNSPHEASRSNAKTPALVATAAGTKAVFALKNASLVLLGGFCNFYTLAGVLKEISRDVLLVPGGLFGSADEVEDSLCVSSLKDSVHGIGYAENAVTETETTLRYVEFLKNGPKTAAKDVKIAFAVDKIKWVPQVTFAKEAAFAVCHPYGTEADPRLLALNDAVAPSAPQAAAAPEPDANAKPAMLSVPEDVPAEAEPAPADPAPAETTGTEKTVSKFKGLFQGFLKTVREEKQELERDLLGVKADKTLTPLRPESEKTPDLLDQVLENTSKPAEKPAEVTASEAEAVSSAREESASRAQAPRADSAAAGGKKKAVVLFSGGLDSTTCLYWALDQGYECEALTVSYGQRHEREVLSAEMITKNLGVKLHKIHLELPWLGSVCSLVDKDKELPDIALEDIPRAGIPSTYVPGRNLMFLSIAASLADAIGAEAIVAGPNAVDFSGYPDCTPAFFKAAGDAINRGTKQGVTEGIDVLAPLMRLSKTQIVQLGDKLHVPFGLTWSCYAGGQKPCGHCDSCKLRAKGFAEAGVKDPSVE